MNTFSTTHLLKCAMLMGALVIPAASWAADHLLSVNGATVIQPAIVPHSGVLTQPMILSDFDNNPTLALGESESLRVVNTPVKICARGTNNKLEWLDQGDSVVGATGVLTGTSASDRYQLTLTMDGISDTYASSNGSCTVSGAKTFAYIAGAAMVKESIGGGAVINSQTDGRDDKHDGGKKDKHSDGRDDKHDSGKKDKHSDGRDDKHDGGKKDKHSDGRDDKHDSGKKDKHSDGRDDKHDGGKKDKHSDGRDDKHDGGKKDKQGGGIGSSVILPVPGITSYNFWNATNGIPEPGTMFLFLSGLLGLGWLSMTRKRQTQGASV